MKQVIAYTTFLIFTACIQLSAQNYGNEWINPSKDYLKIKIARTGIYRIPYSGLIENEKPDSWPSSLTGNKFNLYHNGESVPIYVSDLNSFGSGDFIEFYGRKNDGSFDTGLYADSDDQPHTHLSLYGDTAAYFLTYNAGPSTLINEVSNNLNNPPAQEPYILKTNQYIFTNSFIAGQPEYFPVSLDISTYERGEGYGSTDFRGSSNSALNTYTQAINAEGIYTNGPNAALEFIILSTSKFSHDIQVSMNNNLLLDEQFNNFKMGRHSFSIPASQLTTNNNLIFEAPSIPNTTHTNINRISYIEFTYARDLNLNNRSGYLFSVDGTSGDKYFELTNFDDKGTAPILYDLTNNLRITGIQGGPYRFVLPSRPGNSKREIYIFSQSPSVVNTITSSQVSEVSFINYADLTLSGDYIIITHPSLQDDGNGNNFVAQYAKYRESIEGGSFDVTTVSINQLYDQFAYGISKHPLSIRNFIDYALDNWNTQPQYVLLMGKGIEYNQVNSNTLYKLNMIPTFGHPASDNLLTATNTSIVPRVPIGRIAVQNPAGLEIYLDKIQEFEATQQRVGDPYQTVEEKLWMKHVLHLGGGDNSTDQRIFKSALQQYEQTIEDTLYGANVTSLFKTSTSPIQIVQSEQLTNLISNGVSLIDFFGHASTNSWDFSIDDVSNWNNQGKYPLVLSNSCFVGNMFTDDIQIGEEFVLTPNVGAIGFLGTVSLSPTDGLQNYTAFLYKWLAKDTYHNTLGQIMQKTIESIENNSGGAKRFLSVAEEMSLHGDPAIKINTHTAPDYAIETQLISFSPSVVTTESETFRVDIVVVNLGKAIKDSITIQVSRDYPDGTGEIYEKRVRAPLYADTISFTINTGAANAFGVNQLCFKVDVNNEVANELSETNNEICTILNILSENVFPIHPYEFSIESEQGIDLVASTANVFAATQVYTMQIDTSELFNNPLDSIKITQEGGLLSWQPTITYSDSVVYYWRVGIGNNPTNWSYSSFIYIKDNPPGWNQSHYYQYLKNDFDNTYVDTDRDLKFTPDLKEVSVVTGNAPLNPALDNFELASYFNQSLNHRWVCGGDGYSNGITFVVFDPNSCTNWISEYPEHIIVDPYLSSLPGNPDMAIHDIYKSVHCKQRDFEAFNFPVAHQRQTDIVLQQRVIDFIQLIPDGHYIFVYTVNDASFDIWDQSLVNAFTGLGATMMPIDSGNNGAAPWAFFVQKNNPSSAKEAAGIDAYSILNFSAQFNCPWNQGTEKSTEIGPASVWNYVHWDLSRMEPQLNDNTKVEIVGLSPSGVTNVLYSSSDFKKDTSIAFIDNVQYPNIQLRLDTRDDSTRTPSQIDYWRVHYGKLPEAALNPAFHLEFTGDTVALGNELNLSVAVENVTDLNMTPLLVKYTVIPSGKSPIVDTVRYDSLKANETLILDYSFNTDCNCLSDLNSLVVEVNPDDDQPEQFHFNNIGILDFRLDKDRVNPMLDVTFDGVHILDGDIVSAEPEIIIRLNDENDFLRLDDPSLINVFITDPEGIREEVIYDDVTATFYEANESGNNQAEVAINKKYPIDGTYLLEVHAIDRSRNSSGDYGNPADGFDYRISFEVINESRITNVLNYPNPFTSSTRFVFTLTGSQPPDFMKIQIMTVTGKVVREVTMAELGPIRVGKNITEFAWDGTDMYGDPLGNGLYFYRVVATIAGEDIDKMEKSIDKYFKRDIGKMYLAR